MYDHRLHFCISLYFDRISLIVKWHTKQALCRHNNQLKRISAIVTMVWMCELNGMEKDERKKIERIIPWPGTGALSCLSSMLRGDSNRIDSSGGEKWNPMSIYIWFLSFFRHFLSADRWCGICVVVWWLTQWARDFSATFCFAHVQIWTAMDVSVCRLEFSDGKKNSGCIWIVRLFVHRAYQIKLGTFLCLSVA